MSGPPRIVGEGLVARFTPIRGVTPATSLKQAVYLPAVLNNLAVDEAATHTEYETLSMGTFSQPAMGGSFSRTLRSMSVDAIVLDFDPDWLVVTNQDAWTIRGQLAAVLRGKAPVLMMVTFNPITTQSRAEIYMGVTFREITTEIRAGERESRYMTISISEWRDPSVRRRTAVPPVAPTPAPKKGVTLPTTHALAAKDTLYSLSYAFYGKYTGWTAIRKANAINPKFPAKTPIVHLGGHWKVGLKIKIPKVKV